MAKPQATCRITVRSPRRAADYWIILLGITYGLEILDRVEKQRNQKHDKIRINHAHTQPTVIEFSDKPHTIVDQTCTLQVRISGLLTGGCRSGTNLALQMVLQQIGYTTTTHYHEVSFQSHQEGMLHQTSRSFDDHALPVQGYCFQHTSAVTCIIALHPKNSLKGSAENRSERDQSYNFANGI